MIKAIIFDMVGPLLAKDPNRKWIEAVDIAEKLRRDSKDDEDFKRKLSEDPKTKNYGLDELLGLNVDKYSKIPEVWENLLSGLKGRYKLGIINNGTGLTIPYFKRKNNFGEYFQIFINSSEEGLQKPDPEIYLLACRRLEVKPEECVFIDDTEENVRGAERVGMKGVVYRNFENCVNDLEGIGVQLRRGVKETLC